MLVISGFWGELGLRHETLVMRVVGIGSLEPNGWVLIGVGVSSREATLGGVSSLWVLFGSADELVGTVGTGTCEVDEGEEVSGLKVAKQGWWARV